MTLEEHNEAMEHKAALKNLISDSFNYRYSEELKTTVAALIFILDHLK